MRSAAIACRTLGSVKKTRETKEANPMAYTTGGRKPTRYQIQRDGGFDVVVLTGELQLDDKSGNTQIVDGGASIRDVKMPASNRENVPITIVNVGGQNLLLKDAAGSSITGFGGGASISTLASQERVTVVRVGGVWGHLGISPAIL